MNIKAITSKYAAKILETYENIKLIDVRTKKEWQEVGVPLQGIGKLILLSWRILPYMKINPAFEVEFCTSIKDKNETLFFICRSGVRSLEAASFVASLGYQNCYNIIDGFEGTNSTQGWKNNCLPWQDFEANAR